jgi:hypothetical protein
LVLAIVLITAYIPPTQYILAQDGGKTDRQQPPVPPPLPSSVVGIASTTSPFRPPEADDVTFVVNSGAGLDTGCTFRGGGPLVITLDIKRYVDTSKLAQLKRDGLISPYANVRMPAFDVDFDAAIPGINPERDRVSFNGRVMNEEPSNVEWLTGANDIWKLNGFRVPVEWLNFGDGNGNPGQNQIRIDIDTANTMQAWCTAIDWVSIDLELTPPVLLVHGIRPGPGSAPSYWSYWTTQLTNAGILNDVVELGTPGSIALDSIQSNARKIAAKITDLKQKWGVDQFNFVTHSKGGLDSRHFTEYDRRKTVRKLIQIGTPNGGSMLANIVQGLVIGAGIYFGPTATRLALRVIFSLPAGYQLTTVYMFVYNLIHGRNPDTEYAAIAGNYKFGNFFDTVLKVIHLGDDSDVIVAVGSVSSFGGLDSFQVFASSGGATDAMHSTLPGIGSGNTQTTSPAIYNLVRGLGLFERKTPVAAGRGSALRTPALNAAASASPASFPQTMTIPGRITQGQTNTHDLVIDAVSAVSIPLIYGTGELNLQLISPSGRRIDPAVAASDPQIDFNNLEGDEGLRLEVYTIQQPQVGRWTLEVSAVSLPAGEEIYGVMGWLTNPTITLSAQLDKVSYKTGDPVIVRATLTGGVTGTTAEVKAFVSTPDYGAFSTVALVDDGTGDDTAANDGVYSGRYTNTTAAGTYPMAVQAVGTTPAFSRETLLGAPVSASNTNFSGTNTDSGVDTNSNSLFDELRVNVGLTVSSTGTYHVLGVLADANGNEIDITAETASLAPGSQAVTLRFDGKRIYESRKNGPYTLKVLRLAEEDVTLLPLAELANAYTTTAYNFNQFEHDPISVLRTGIDSGIDSNGNGLFDLLRVELDADIDTAGFYEWSARLVAPDGSEVGFVANTGLLAAGRNALRFEYDGKRIGASALDGPYTVRDLLIFGSSASTVVFTAYTTSGYRAAQFEGGPGGGGNPGPGGNGGGANVGGGADSLPGRLPSTGFPPITLPEGNMAGIAAAVVMLASALFAAIVLMRRKRASRR